MGKVRFKFLFFFSESFFLLFDFLLTLSFFYLANLPGRQNFYTQVCKRAYSTGFQIVFLSDGIVNLVTIDEFPVA
ncbi:MAG: hypothetical protein A3J94_14370 [Syntrophus sp. RIFOXYC2_FULL_54_9]|nr:MAG: hypothetical protein A2X92_08340 [Syntrophus sp. GWC2_56_31]OHE26637.1 MAG: hypothetical protein A3J94_14370 [Syntrophus sp. RIFOXYC2_FULL_54_9]